MPISLSTRVLCTCGITSLVAECIAGATPLTSLTSRGRYRAGWDCRSSAYRGSEVMARPQDLVVDMEVIGP